MTQKEFIEKIAQYHKKYAKQFGFKIVSPAIAQACLESAYGTSYKANHNNYFGLKYNAKTPNRCPSATGYFADQGSEQNPDGSYVSGTMLWWDFPSMEAGVKGYYEFLVNGYGRYDAAKEATDPRTYLQILKDAGYATSLKYVDNVMNVVNNWSLTQYDKDEETPVSTEVKVDYVKFSPNRTSPRQAKIDTITIHHMAGNLTVESCGNIFQDTGRQASSNYGIGTDGRIGMYVSEGDRSWCSGSRSNDHRAITIEVANDNTKTYTISNAAMNSLIRLCADICKRNGIGRLVWSDNKDDRINHLNGCNMTVHRDFQATSCPGDYLMSKMGYITNEVNKILGAGTVEPPKETNPYPVPTRTLKKTTPTTTGEDVKWLQWELVNRGFMDRYTASGADNIDGRFGGGTETALKKLQEAYGLQVDGSCGPATRKRLLNEN